MTNPDSQPGSLCVALLSPGWPAESFSNGIVSYTAAIVRGLQDIGAACHVLTPQLASQCPEPFVHPVRTNDRSLISRIMWRLDPTGWPHRLLATALAREVKRLRRECGLNILELEESHGLPRLLAGRCPVPVVVRLHGPWFLNGVANGVVRDESFRQRDAWEKQGIMSAAAVSAPSRHVLDQTRAHFGLELPGAAVIPNPVDPVAVADRWNLQTCDRSRIVFVGRFDRHKGGDTVIDAFAHVLRQRRDARLDFVGPDRGCIDDAGRTWMFEEYLRARLPEGDRAKVTYHGFLPLSQAAELRKRTLVTVAPSRYETFGIAAAEAMAAGCPLVVCDAGAQTEMVQHDRNGLVAPAGDAAAVAGQVLWLLNNPERAAALGRQAAIDAHDRYSPIQIASQTLEFYRSALNFPKPTTEARRHGGAPSIGS